VQRAWRTQHLYLLLVEPHKDPAPEEAEITDADILGRSLHYIKLNMMLLVKSIIQLHVCPKFLAATTVAKSLLTKGLKVCLPRKWAYRI
jgi:hypothetical protein